MRVLMFVICLLFLAPRARADEDAASSTKDQAAQLEFFEKKVRPLLAKHCLECHSAKEAKDNGELNLETPAGIAKGGGRGSLISSGKPDESLIVEAVRYSNPDLEMPPDGKLAPADIAIVERWIRNGAVLPDYNPDDIRRTGSDIDFAAARNYWAFQPLHNVPLPSVTDKAWPRQPLDQFILHRLEVADLTPSPEAARRVLIRRLTFDLTGLPPTPQQVADFLHDQSPHAYERLVDRLLNSPQYGERWARVWLDLARYTDKTAKWLTATDNAWIYRDWVVDAFNRNLPYDQFVKRQLAADLMPGVPVEDQAALGFLGLSPTYWKELRLAPAVISQVVAEEWDERIDAVSRTFLGLTVSCARCHDHKFDPITMRDYYGLAGVFASTQFDARPLMPNEQAASIVAAHEKVAALQAKLAAIKDKKSEEAASLSRQIGQIKRNTSDYNRPFAHLVKESSIYVEPDGEDKTKLTYRDDEPRNLPVFRRGNPSNPGEIVPRRFLEVLSTDSTRPFEHGSGRLDLAECLFSEAQGLTARVFVNRIWAEHFGRGIVRTTSDFGSQGDPPTHPELLEYLASEFVRDGWNIRELHRSIVLSSTYRQSSRISSEAAKLDPENKLLSRMNRRRLSIEMWRDAMLAVAGNLDAHLGGPALPVDAPSNRRRTIYGLVDRHELNTILRLFDFPEATAHSPRRETTTTPLQQLYVLNSPFFERQSQQLVKSLQSEPQTKARLMTAYRRLFARPPTESELAIGLRFLGENPTTERWTTYAHALLSLNEFFYVD